LEPTHLKTFLKNKNSDIGENFLTSIKNLDTIKFEKSISLFHDINELLIIFHNKNKTPISTLNKKESHNITKKMNVLKTKKMTKKRT
jgi:hypothetical protein